MREIEFKDVKIGDELYIIGKSKHKGRRVVVTNKYVRYAEVELDGARPLYSFYALSRNPVGSEPKQQKKKKKPSRAVRENMLITMGCRAGEMCGMGHIALPVNVSGEDELARFVVGAVDRYIEEDIDESFDCYIEEALMKEYGKE